MSILGYLRVFSYFDKILFINYIEISMTTVVSYSLIYSFIKKIGNIKYTYESILSLQKKCIKSIYWNFNGIYKLTEFTEISVNSTENNCLGYVTVISVFECYMQMH